MRKTKSPDIAAPAPERPSKEATTRNEAHARLVVLLSHERSGSHYLADMLASGGELVSFDEVCNFDAIDPDTSKVSFFGFRRNWHEANPCLALRPTADAMADFLDSYVGQLLGIEQARHVLLDVKYGHVHNFEPGWWPPTRRPFLLKYLDRHKVRVIHLTRRNTLAAAVSQFAADEAGVWQRRVGDEPTSPARLRMPAANVVQRAIVLQREREDFSAWLTGNRCFDLAYEDICEPDAVKEQRLGQLCEFLGISPSSFFSAFEKMMPPLPQLVENYGELRRLAAIFGVAGLPVSR